MAAQADAVLLDDLDELQRLSLGTSADAPAATDARDGHPAHRERSHGPTCVANGHSHSHSHSHSHGHSYSHHSHHHEHHDHHAHHAHDDRDHSLESPPPSPPKYCSEQHTGCCSGASPGDGSRNSILSGLTPHSHGIATHHAIRDEKKLMIALFMYVALVMGELCAAAASRSRILAVEALHAALDTLTVVFALVSLRVARRPPSPYTATFGYARAEVLTALISVLWLFTIMGALVYSSLRIFIGWDQVEDIHGLVVIAAGAAGFCVNFAVHTVLRPPVQASDATDLERAQEQEAMNVKAARAHALADSMESLVALVVGAAVFLRPDWTLLDPVLSIFVGLLVIVVNWRIVQDAWSILMEFAPKSVGLEKLASDLRGIQGVDRVDRLHVWTIGMSQVVGTVRLRVSAHADNSVERLDLIRRSAKSLFESRGVTESFAETTLPIT